MRHFTCSSWCFILSIMKRKQFPGSDKCLDWRKTQISDFNLNTYVSIRKRRCGVRTCEANQMRESWQLGSWSILKMAPRVTKERNKSSPPKRSMCYLILRSILNICLEPFIQPSVLIKVFSAHTSWLRLIAQNKQLTSSFRWHFPANANLSAVPSLNCQHGGRVRWAGWWDAPGQSTRTEADRDRWVEDHRADCFFNWLFYCLQQTSPSWREVNKSLTRTR